MIPLQFCKFSQSVRMNGSENLSFDSKMFDIFLYSVQLEHGYLAVVSIKNRTTGEVVHTTAANTPYFILKDQEKFLTIQEEPKAEAPKTKRSKKVADAETKEV